MKKSITILGLFAFMMVLTSFTEPIKLDKQSSTYETSGGTSTTNQAKIGTGS